MLCVCVCALAVHSAAATQTLAVSCTRWPVAWREAAHHGPKPSPCRPRSRRRRPKHCAAAQSLGIWGNLGESTAICGSLREFAGETTNDTLDSSRITLTLRRRLGFQLMLSAAHSRCGSSLGGWRAEARSRRPKHEARGRPRSRCRRLGIWGNLRVQYSTVFGFVP